MKSPAAPHPDGRVSFTDREREPYPATSHWSKPDLEAAARLLRYVYERQDGARDKGLRAAENVRALHSPAVGGPVIRERLATIRLRRAARPANALNRLA